MHNAQLLYRLRRLMPIRAKPPCGGLCGGFAVAPTPLRSCGLLIQSCLLIANYSGAAAFKIMRRRRTPQLCIVHCALCIVHCALCIAKATPALSQENYRKKVKKYHLRSYDRVILLLLFFTFCISSCVLEGFFVFGVHFEGGEVFFKIK